MKYEEMKPREIDEILATRPIAYLVWGAHEWHGVHNPVGLDTLKAYQMTLDLCKVTGGVVLPPVYCGYQTMKPWMGFRHTLEFSRDLVTQYVFEHLENLYEEGFKVIVVVMGHYGKKHVEAVNAAVSRFTDKHRYPKVLAIRDFDPASWIKIGGGDHGGKHETSLMMYYREDLVDMSRLPEGEVVHGRDGVSPTAKEATRAHGEMLARTFVEQAAPKVNELLEAALKEWPKEKAGGPRPE